MRTTTARCTGHSFPASTIIQWHRAPSSQRCSGRLAASGLRLIDMRVPSHFTSGAYFSPTLLADVLIPGQPTRVRRGYLSSPLARPPSHSPSSCIPRARPVPCEPLALFFLLPLIRALCLRCRPEALKR
ncbi:hypothetical protein B0H17DRAFT_108592 [Mycena rosella]|uniref:Uncharacterized protein n=1 Tax=Mycena rosella TaxID=1033263 RepID=A0AAD7F5N4_MYCRO|nr:hypothetical protein B0H17DRAFT_108592 [Mycena rosella]